jgi:arsenate reductase
MAEAILNLKGKGRWRAESAGSRPADRVNPLAIAAIERHGLHWNGHPPRGVDGLEDVPWDFVITVCDRAKEACPYFPGQPIIAHWGMEDPAEVEGTDEQRSRAFDLAWQILARRIDLLIALPVEKLERLALEHRVRAIATHGSPVPAMGDRT